MSATALPSCPACSTCTPTLSPYSMGLRGWVSQLANMTAIGVICLLFAYDHTANRQQANEDRLLFREAIQVTRQSNDRLAQEIRRLTDEIKKRNLP
jgi:uncharacterized protein YlxW (UPF0749 family)